MTMQNQFRLLVIDDDDLTQVILRKLLEAESYGVQVCSSGPEALDLLAWNDFDAILCDMWMAGMNGKEFYLKLKEDYPDYQRKIIFITGDIASEATWEFIDERHLPYVLKPISRPLRRRKVREIVGDPATDPETGEPAVWDGVNRRRDRRVNINAQVRVRRKKWEITTPDMAVVVNASRNGLMFASEREYRVGMELLVAYPYTGYDDVEQDAYVMRVEKVDEKHYGIAVALGKEASYARAAYAGSEEDVRRNHIWRGSDITSTSLLASELMDAGKMASENQDTQRLAEEMGELKRTLDNALDKRDRLEAELEEMEKSKQALSHLVDGLNDQMVDSKKKMADYTDQQYRATHDALTTLWNRAAILDNLKRELVRAEREGTSVGVLLADLDHFKNVNDTYGHLAGDAVLREAAKRINGAVRDYDAVGRYGGEEFLIVLGGCEDDDDMMKQAERIRAIVGAGPVQTSEGDIQVTLSMGVASSVDMQEVETLLRAADTALYRAKRGGRNRVELGCATESKSS